MSFGALMKIQKLLSRHNVELLWTAIGGLANPKNPAFNAYWRWFRDARGGSLEDVTAGAALMEKLRDILKEHLEGMR